MGIVLELRSRILWNPNFRQLSWCRMAFFVRCIRSWWIPASRHIFLWTSVPGLLPLLWSSQIQMAQHFSYRSTFYQKQQFLTSARKYKPNYKLLAKMSYNYNYIGLYLCLILNIYDAHVMLKEMLVTVIVYMWLICYKKNKNIGLCGTHRGRLQTDFPAMKEC